MTHEMQREAYFLLRRKEEILNDLKILNYENFYKFKFCYKDSMNISVYQPFSFENDEMEIVCKNFYIELLNKELIKIENELKNI